MADADGAEAPTAFMSYSHDSQEHGDWVLNLATRLCSDGVDVLLDQWELAPGDDLPRFMEGIAHGKWVLAVCTDHYVAKAEGRHGGVGYESGVLTGAMFNEVRNRGTVIPILRSTPGSAAVPAFMGSLVHIDMRSDEDFEVKYEELLRRLHDSPKTAKPPLGPNPFARRDGDLYAPPSMLPGRYVAPALSGCVEFPYQNNDGTFALAMATSSSQRGGPRQGQDRSMRTPMETTSTLWPSPPVSRN